MEGLPRRPLRRRKPREQEADPDTPRQGVPPGPAAPEARARSRGACALVRERGPRRPARARPEGDRRPDRRPGRGDPPGAPVGRQPEARVLGGPARRDPRERAPGRRRLRHVRRRPAHGRRPGPRRPHHLRPADGCIRHRAGHRADARRPPALPRQHHRRLQPLLRPLRAPALRRHGPAGAGLGDARPGPGQRPAWSRSGCSPPCPPSARCSRARSTIPSPRGSPSCACA